MKVCLWPEAGGWRCFVDLPCRMATLRCEADGPREWCTTRHQPHGVSVRHRRPRDCGAGFESRSRARQRSYPSRVECLLIVAITIDWSMKGREEVRCQASLSVAKPPSLRRYSFMPSFRRTQLRTHLVEPGGMKDLPKGCDKPGEGIYPSKLESITPRRCALAASLAENYRTCA